MNNHRVSAEVVRCLPGDAKYIDDVIDDDMLAAGSEIRDSAATCSAETSRKRIRALKR